MRRIGLLGGTFDPIHYGHLHPAEQAAELLNLDELRLLPNAIPPHKPGTHATQAQRLTMLQLAVANRPRFTLDLRELARKQTSYTVDTLRELRSAYPDDALFFLMGTDSFASLNRWHRWQELLPLANLVINQRPGGSFPQSGEMADYYQAHAHGLDGISRAGGIYRLQTDVHAISSTQIRQHIAMQQQGWQTLLPETVAAYITQQQLYQAG